MKEGWSLTPLGEILEKSEEWIDINPEGRYKQITVKIWGKGVIERNEVTGAEISGSKRLKVKAGEFIVSRIDARHGAFGLIPDFLDGAIVTNDFPVFIPNPSCILPKYLDWMSKTRSFIDLCVAASEGTTNRVRLKEDRFLSMQIPLPPLDEQRRIVARIEELATKVEEARLLRRQTEQEINATLFGAYKKIIDDAQWLPMEEVAPLERRAIEVKLSESYPELGVRSFGKGTFHKPALNGAEVGTKKLFRIEPGDLVFQIVFAWEGAIAVAQEKDQSRFGSHRFLTCVPKRAMATSPFLCFHFLTKKGLQDLGEASPGGAGRNRTLGLKALANIKVPVPSYEKIIWFDDLQAKVDALKHLQAQTATELDAFIPSILDKAFKGEL